MDSTWIPPAKLKRLFNLSSRLRWGAQYFRYTEYRGGSRVAATSKMERFVIIGNGWKPITINTKHSILDVAAALDPPPEHSYYFLINNCSNVSNFLN